MTMYTTNSFSKHSRIVLLGAFIIMSRGGLSPEAAAEVPPAGPVSISKREDHIAAALRDRELTPLQADFLLLASRNFDSPRDRFISVRDWKAQNGDALEAELAAKHARDEPRRLARIAAARRERAARIADDLSSGRLGPLEAELANLMNRDFANPGGRMRALSAWNASNREAIDAERRSRYGVDTGSRADLAAKFQARRNRSIAEAAATGRIGPLEAEFLALCGEHNPNLREKHDAIRAWLAKHGEALGNERATRAAASQP